ncbi:MAG: DUF4838 domain-containing protein [Clostridia bacterium]|nr:DUF4838 domain-containing protein [Clostridia bacterium]
MIVSKNAKISLIIPEKATTREIYAAETLQSYLRKIFNAEAVVCKEGESVSGNAIVIGGPERNAEAAKYISEAAFRALFTGPEGICIKALDENRILIAGSSWHVGECERGTVYGVFEFLERFLGCTLAAYSHPEADAGEIVPMLDEIDLDGIDYCKSGADLPYRTAIVQYGDWAGNCDHGLNVPFFDWLVKNRYNRILTWASVYEYFKKHGLLAEIERRGIRFTVGHHESSRLFLPPEGNENFPEPYYKTHPEYYKLLEDGTRFFSESYWGQWIFCSRNDEAIAEVAKNVTAWLSDNPSVDILAFWPNDGTAPQCRCPKCKPYSKVENYAHFVNGVVKEVKKTHPHVKFDMLLYVDLWECPEGLELDPSVLIDESTWAAEGLRTVGKPDGSCLNGTKLEANLLQWKKTGAEVVYYDYYMGVYSLRQRWIPMADEIQSIWKNFVRKGISGAGTQIECFNLWNHIFNFYTFGRTGYDTSLSMQDNLKRFTRLFGDGGAEIAEIVTALEACLDGQVPIPQCGHYLTAHIDKEAIYAKFERALERAQTPRYRNNIRMLRMVFRYTDLETGEPFSSNHKFAKVVDGYEDATGELAKLTEFDSYCHGSTGFGVNFPLKSDKIYAVDDKWYRFE